VELSSVGSPLEVHPTPFYRCLIVICYHRIDWLFSAPTSLFLIVSSVQTRCLYCRFGFKLVRLTVTATHLPSWVCCCCWSCCPWRVALGVRHNNLRSLSHRCSDSCNDPLFTDSSPRYDASIRIIARPVLITRIVCHCFHTVAAPSGSLRLERWHLVRSSGLVCTRRSPWPRCGTSQPHNPCSNHIH